MSQIEAYLYGSGAATGSVSAMDTYHTIGINEGGATVKVRMNASGRFTAALTTWQTNINASSLTGSYAVTISAGNVTIEETGGSVFTLYMYGSAGKVLGFTGTQSGSPAYTGGLSSAWIELVGYECEPLAPGDRVELTQYRHGRAVALGFGNVDLFRASLFVNSTAYGPQIAKLVGDGGGYALTGRVRIQGNDASAYSATNPDGYVDGYVVETPELETYGESEAFARVAFVVAVPR